ncbi:MAG: insulinase family protein [Geopsychrobacter sp.]|nr:insulinase family protein [Geopsychrobacter sp.]
MPEYHIDTLTNGLRLVTVEMPHLHNAELVCYLGTGGRNETKELAGISHFLEHMLFRGAGSYANSRAIDRAFETLGGAVNASTDAESTCYHSRVHPDHACAGIAIFAEMLRKPLFNDLEIERRIILEEAREDYNQQGAQTNPDNLMAALLWPNHPLGMPLIGSDRSLQTIGLDELHAFHQQHYVPQNTLVTCCGPIDRIEILAATKKYFGDWNGIETTAPLPALAQPIGPHQQWTCDSDSQICLQLAFPMAGRNDQRPLQFSLLRRILSWGGSALLPQRLREECGLTYAIEANCSMLADTGYFSIDLAVAPQNLVPAIDETLKVLERLRQSPPEDSALEAARTSYLYDIEFSLDQPEAMSVRYGWGLQADCLRTLEQDRSEVKAIQANQIQDLACELFNRDKLHLVVVGPWDKQQRTEVEQRLKAFATSAPQKKIKG